MVHNGIEYGDMQLICEAYNLMKNGLGRAPMKCTPFKEWNEGDLDSYLIEITRDILGYKDEEPLVKKFRYRRPKGTGKWTVINSGTASHPLIAEAVFARCIALKDDRIKASTKLRGPSPPSPAQAKFIEDTRCIVASRSSATLRALCSWAAKNYDWKLNYGNIALMWRSCIIRSASR